MIPPIAAMKEKKKDSKKKKEEEKELPEHIELQRTHVVCGTERNHHVSVLVRRYLVCAVFVHAGRLMTSFDPVE